MRVYVKLLSFNNVERVERFLIHTKQSIMELWKHEMRKRAKESLEVLSLSWYDFHYSRCSSQQREELTKVHKYNWKESKESQNSLVRFSKKMFVSRKKNFRNENSLLKKNFSASQFKHLTLSISFEATGENLLVCLLAFLD